VRKIFLTIFGLWLCGLLVSVLAETVQLTDGTSLTGDVLKFDDSGMLFRAADNTYTNISWTKFSQDSLQQLAKNPKIKVLVEPFIEVSESKLARHEEVKIQDVTRLTEPPGQSLFGALFSSSVGIVVLLLIYAANLYAAFEIAVCRARPIALVVGLAAVLPVIGPVIFLSLPIKVEGAPLEAGFEPDPATLATPGNPAAAPQSAETTSGVQVVQPAAASHPAPQVFKRGQFTFNKRFIETKFDGFFGAVRHGASKDMVLLVKTARQEFVAERITRIAASDVHFESVQGAARPEVMVAFADIQEIQIKHKDT